MTEDGPAPPALGVKVKVASTFCLEATRSPAAMLKETALTAPPIWPLDTGGKEAAGSVSVCTVIEKFAALALAPILQPTSVTVTAVPAASALPAAASTMDVSPGCAGVSVAPAVETLAVGVAEVANKPDG